MKKFIALFTAILFSGSVLAEAGLTVGLGYQTSEIANSDRNDGDPTGLSINLQYAIPGVDGMFVAVDITDQEDEADNGAVDTITTNQERTALTIGYVFALDDNTSISAAVSSADVQWDWEDGNPGAFQRFEGDDSGVSVSVGAEKNIGNGVILGTSLSLGFESGVEAYTSFEMIDNLDIKLSYYKSSYELEYEEFDEAGSAGAGSAFGDGDFQYDTSGFRVSANYSF